MAWTDLFKLFWYAMKSPPTKNTGGIVCGPFIPDLRSDKSPMTQDEIKAAVAKVIMKPGNPCDPDGVFNE